jgi:AcrR family transcriptional regulator
MCMSTSAADRPLRRDAVRNRARILEAAGRLFAERGLGATLNDVAHYAGVGVGTVYRHFPDKDELIETLFETRVDELVAIGETGLADPDPWHGLVWTIERNLELQATDRGLSQLIHDSPQGLERIVRVRERLLPIGRGLIRRAQAAGAVRADIETGDLPIIQLMITLVLDASRDVDPELWRRYLALLLRGIATHPGDLPELPHPAPSPDAVDRVMTARPARRR